jgi:hypothetical protein
LYETATAAHSPSAFGFIVNIGATNGLRNRRLKADGTSLFHKIVCRRALPERERRTSTAAQDRSQTAVPIGLRAAASTRVVPTVES